MLKHVLLALDGRTGNETLGSDSFEHSVTVLDPLEIFGPKGSLSQISSVRMSYRDDSKNPPTLYGGNRVLQM